MTTYRMMAFIPQVATLPGGGSPIVASDADIDRALDSVLHFPEDMDQHSNGMCTIKLSVRVVTSPLPTTVYSTLSGQNYIHPVFLADHLGDSEEYDGFITMNPAVLTTATTFRGVGGTSGGTLSAWVKIGSQEREILCHEFGHAMTVYLGTVMGTYTNFPTCGGEPAMHCAETYGFPNDLDDGWLDGFFQGTLSDNTGINATGWAVDTPTETGAVTLPHYRPLPSRWGRLGPLHFDEGAI